MSMPRGTKITCPDCGKEGNFTIWHSVNVDSDPETREQVKNGKLFEYVCDKCGKNFNVEYKFLYHDCFNKFLIWYMPRRDYDITKEAENINNMPSNRFWVSYRQRVVDTKLSLIEKIKIFEMGLNDIIIEIIKSFIIDEAEDNNVEVIFDRIEDEYLIFYMSNGKGVKYPYETYMEMIKDIPTKESQDCIIVNTNTAYQYCIGTGE